MVLTLLIQASHGFSLNVSQLSYHVGKLGHLELGVRDGKQVKADLHTGMLLKIEARHVELFVDVVDPVATENLLFIPAGDERAVVHRDGVCQLVTSQLTNEHRHFTDAPVEFFLLFLTHSVLRKLQFEFEALSSLI